MNEFIYILENPSMPGIVKIGRTERTASERASELSSHTGVPTEFILVKEYAVIDSVAADGKSTNDCLNIAYPRTESFSELIVMMPP